MRKAENVIRKIAVITGSRAEYGLLYWLLKEIEADKALELQLIATGMHLSPEFGLTYQVIEKDGFKITAKVEMQLSSDSRVGVAKSVGLGIIGFADVLERLKPDLVVLLGDRFEILAAAQAAMFLNIPIAHLHGGEVTEAAFDDAIRHAITKMSYLHFVAAEPYRKRVIQLGEAPERVFNVGALGIDYLVRMDFLKREELAHELNIEFNETNFLVTFHPETMGGEDPRIGINELFLALDQFPQVKIIFTKSNADTGGREINYLIDEYVSQNPERTVAFLSLGQKKYLSLMQEVDLVIGNSSSGIFEAPFLKTPTVNIGKRQQGRLRTSSIFDCEVKSEAITRTIQDALAFKDKLKILDFQMIYGNGQASIAIKNTIKDYPFNQNSVKSFYDIKSKEL